MDLTDIAPKLAFDLVGRVADNLKYELRGLIVLGGAELENGVGTTSGVALDTVSSWFFVQVMFVLR